MVELRYRGRTVQVPVWIMPGQAERSVTVPLGYGRRRAGRVGNGVGVDVYRSADRGRALVRGRASRSARRASAAGWRPCSTTSAWKAAT